MRGKIRMSEGKGVVMKRVVKSNGKGEREGSCDEKCSKIQREGSCDEKGGKVQREGSCDEKGAVMKREVKSKGKGVVMKRAVKSKGKGVVMKRETSGQRHGELTTAERQEIQIKKAKLVNMLDEVEQRYRQYHHQIQIVISWFEQAAGNGSAKTYTALALQTISKQFRCLKDAITGQIRSSSKSLGEENGFGGGRNEGSRLRFVDHQLRQQRALQQLGMIQPNAWRPQRGLPERSVSVLRAWLFEHFLHPYPKDSDKSIKKISKGDNNTQILLQVSNMSKTFASACFQMFSSLSEECEDLSQKVKDGLLKKPTIKRQLPQKPSEQSRLLQVVPKVIADVSELETMANDAIKENKQGDESLPKSILLGSSAISGDSSKGSGFSSVAKKKRFLASIIEELDRSEPTLRETKRPRQFS
ncbi:unnamed protein product [Camellia sinensis]